MSLFFVTVSQFCTRRGYLCRYEELVEADKAACGEIIPFEERYDEKRMYFRDSREKWEKGSVRK